MKRIRETFKNLRNNKECGFVAYICAGDPDYQTSLELLMAMPKAGADIIELGIPFLDPSGDGPIIENAAKRAVSAGMTVQKTLKMVTEFRKHDQKTPLILMSYYNPLLKYGLKKIFTDAKKSGVDGILIVDLPFEEEDEINAEISRSNLDLIRLIAPTTNQKRSKKITKNSSGFIYLISMLGITGTKTATVNENKENLQKLREISDLPIAIGFGIKTPQQAQDFAKSGFDAVIIGSSIVEKINDGFLAKKSSAKIASDVAELARSFAQKIKDKKNG